MLYATKNHLHTSSQYNKSSKWTENISFACELNGGKSNEKRKKKSKSLSKNKPKPKQQKHQTF